ncbi:carboxypeptidase regulatory-like domain-containing protein [Hyalangium versicolor]|uniref:carboxypeptidase regulatory-like domain-containing protein n=1 Tax=Hyalangium versicolor TaxID=2861190 RepID=UPI001CC98DAD|nr:carboxypeptidase regulatory-like domain-containing protein [Hyalangium versicolor]
MRRYLGRVWVFVVVAAAVGLAVYGRAEQQALRQIVPREPAEASREPSRVESLGLPSGPPGEVRTLPVAETASESDGLLELRITSAGLPVPRAQVRLYRRDGRMPETRKVDWRVAGAGATGDDGRLLMPALAGSYLVVVRAEGLAPAWLNLMHPLGVPRTPVSLRLEEATLFTGRTVLQGSGRPLPGAELTLTPDVSPWEGEELADAPAEERVTVTTDSEGRFRLEGLAPGVYTLEGRSSGSSYPLEWTVRLPQSEPQVLALPRPTGEKRTRTPQRQPSKELRCGM